MDHGKSCDEAVRCPCGSLLARMVPGGVEIKCRRCKQVCVIPLDTQVERQRRQRR